MWMLIISIKCLLFPCEFKQKAKTFTFYYFISKPCCTCAYSFDHHLGRTMHLSNCVNIRANTIDLGRLQGKMRRPHMKLRIVLPIHIPVCIENTLFSALLRWHKTSVILQAGRVFISWQKNYSMSIKLFSIFKVRIKISFPEFGVISMSEEKAESKKVGKRWNWLKAFSLNIAQG